MFAVETFLFCFLFMCFFFVGGVFLLIFKIGEYIIAIHISFRAYFELDMTLWVMENLNSSSKMYDKEKTLLHVFI